MAVSAVGVDHHVGSFRVGAAAAVPTRTILPSSMTIESPAATGSRQSPETNDAEIDDGCFHENAA